MIAFAPAEVAWGWQKTPQLYTGEPAARVVARGEASLYLRHSLSLEYREKVWDHAAGVLITEEAGGRVTDFAGNPFSIYGKQIVASNGKIHDEMVAVLARCSA